MSTVETSASTVVFVFNFADQAPTMVVVVNWLEELKAKLRTK